jgi:hypothetical protein
MNRRFDHGTSFEVPHDWSERTIVAFTAPERGDDPSRGAGPNLVVMRDMLREGETLRTHASRRLLQLGKQLNKFDLLEMRQIEVGGRAAIQIRFAWLSNLGALEESLTMVEREDERGRTITTFATSALSADAQAARTVFERILGSVAFDGPVAPTPPSRSDLAEEASASPPYVPMPGTRDHRR